MHPRQLTFTFQLYSQSSHLGPIPQLAMHHALLQSTCPKTVQHCTLWHTWDCGGTHLVKVPLRSLVSPCSASSRGPASLAWARAALLDRGVAPSPAPAPAPEAGPPEGSPGPLRLPESEASPVPESLPAFRLLPAAVPLPVPAPVPVLSPSVVPAPLGLSAAVSWASPGVCRSRTLRSSGCRATMTHGTWARGEHPTVRKAQSKWHRCKPVTGGSQVIDPNGTAGGPLAT